MNRSRFLGVLPAFKNESIVIEEDQSLDDIVNEVLTAHQIFAPDYDMLLQVFRMPADLYQWLFDFCKKNISYEVETVDGQSVKSPAGILQLGKGDCKHYASFIGGVLDALVRTGYDIKWRYRFATYAGSDGSHVFIVVKDGQSEIWIDPVLSYLDQRYPAPATFFDRKIKSDMLTRVSGISDPVEAVEIFAEEIPADGFVSNVVITRADFDRMSSADASSCNVVGLVAPVGREAYTDAPYEGFQDLSGDGYTGGGGGGGYTVTTVPPVQPAQPVYPKPFEGVQYLVNGQPLVFPPKGARATLPANLVVIYPETYNGYKLPGDLPKPMPAGNRLVILPKLAVGVRDQYNFNDYMWIKFIRSALTPLIQSYGQQPDWDQNNLYQTIWSDTDREEVVDYITSRPVQMAFDWELLQEVAYYADGEPLVFAADRSYNGNDYNGSHPPAKIPDSLSVVYPDTYKGFTVPDNLPRPVMANGKLQLQPHGFGVDNMRANYYMWLSFLVSVMTPLIRSYCQYPYTGNDDLTDRVWNDIAANKHLDDYLVAPDKKTFLGEVIEKLAGYVQEVTRLSLKVINAGSRLAFLGLVRINAFAFAYKLFLSLNDPERKDKLFNRWRNLGGNTGDFQKAIILGCKNNPVFGGGVKQWIEDAVQDGIIDNGYVKPAGDDGIPDGQSMSGAYVGIAVADDVVYYMAAASSIIAALGAFLKGIGGEKTDALVDNVIAGYDVVMTIAGEDPIGTGAQLGANTVIKDPATGNQYTIKPPATVDNKVNPVWQFVKNNPGQVALVAAGVAGGAYLLLDNNKKKSSRAAAK